MAAAGQRGPGECSGPRGEPCGKGGPFPGCCSCVPALRSGSSLGAQPGRAVGLRAVLRQEGASAKEGERSAGGPALIKSATNQNNPASTSRNVLTVRGQTPSRLPFQAAFVWEAVAALALGRAGTRPCSPLPGCCGLGSAAAEAGYKALLLCCSLLVQLSHFSFAC